MRITLRATALGLLLGAAVGLVDGLRAPPMAGESAAARLAGLVAVDAAVGAAAALLLGLALALALPRPPRRWPDALAAATLAAGLLALAAHGGRSAPVLVAEAARAGRLEATLPPLLADRPQAVLIITLDTVRADALARMPRLQARAATALRFDHARSTSSWTLPAIASLHTGLPYPAHGAAQVRDVDGIAVRTGLDPAAPTLAEALQDRGFVTLAATTNPLNGQRYGFHRGHDRFVDLSRAALRAHALRRATLLRPLVRPRPDRADAVTDQALAWLPAAAPGRFALWLHYLDGHAPYSADPGGFDPLGPCALPDCFDDWASVRRGTATYDAAARARVRALYDADLAWLDAQLDRLFTAWDAAGLFDRSLVILTADHGEAFWEPAAHGREEVEHGGSFREELVHVPLLVWAPGAPPARRTHAVDLTALRPAVLSWVDGGGLGPLDDGADMRTPMGSLLFADGVEACTDGRRKLVRHGAAGPGGARLELYDLRTDPGERSPQPGAAATDLLACIEGARQHVGQGVGGDIGALRALGYVE